MTQKVAGTPHKSREFTELGRFIRFQRKQRKMSVATLASNAGLSRRTVTAIEKGGNPTVGALTRIMAALSIGAVHLDADYRLEMNETALHEAAGFLDQAVRQLQTIARGVEATSAVLQSASSLLRSLDETPHLRPRAATSFPEKEG